MTLGHEADSEMLQDRAKDFSGGALQANTRGREVEGEELKWAEWEVQLRCVPEPAEPPTGSSGLHRAVGIVLNLAFRPLPLEVAGCGLPPADAVPTTDRTYFPP